MKLAFLGLGVMGYPMAGHLQKAGNDVTVYNRNGEKAKKWAAEYGGKTAATPAEAAKDQEIVFCCVGRDADLRDVTLGAQGAFGAMKKGSLFVDHTTASASSSRAMEAEAVVWSTNNEPFFMAPNAPCAPSVTSRKSASRPTQQNTISWSLAASAGVAAVLPPYSAAHFLAFSPLRL